MCVDISKNETRRTRRVNDYPTREMILRIYLLLVLCVCSAAGQDLDPCVAYTNLTDAARSVDNQPRQQDLLLCDRNLPVGWYRMVNGMMPTRCLQPFSCGTQAPIWLNGSVPTQEQGTVRMTACANTIPEGRTEIACCGAQIPIDLRNCGDFVVYCLRPPPRCPMSYCIEPAPQQLSPPTLTGPEIIGDRFRFACNIDFPLQVQNIAFTVTWTFDGVDIPNREPELLTGDRRTAFLDQDAWRGNIGRTLRCRVEAFYITSPLVRSPALVSNSYFGGIRVTPSVVTVREAGGPQLINVTSTLPVLCAGVQECNIQLDIDVRGGSWEDITTANQCLLLLTRDSWNPNTRTATISTTVQATRDFVQDGNQQLEVAFIPNYSRAPDIWLGYRLPELRVFTVDGRSTRCSAFADPHIRTFEGRDTLHLYEIGDFVMLRSSSRRFEVDIRTNECAGRACVCAVAIMDGDDVISVDVCRQRWGAPPARVRILSGGTLSAGTRIKRTNDGRNFMITFASGAWLRVQDFATYLNVEVQVPAQDFGHVQGICGTFDGNANNELRGPDGRVFGINNNIPTEFFISWRLRADQSLLNGAIRPSINNRISVTNNINVASTQCFCNNITGTVDCGQNRVIQDPVRSVCNSCTDVTDRVIVRTQNGSIEDDANDEAVTPRPDVNPDVPAFRTPIHFNLTVNVNIVIPGLVPGNNPVVTPTTTPPAAPRTDPATTPTSTAAITPRPRPPVQQPEFTPNRARLICREAMLNFTLGVRCEGLQFFDKQGFIRACIEDMVTAQTTVFLQATIAAMEAACQDSILRNISNFGTDNQGRRLPPPEVTTDLCPNQCTLRGVCSNGRCLCNQGFTAPDCSVDMSRPPQVLRILRNGLCNAQRRPCRISFIVVENFYETPNIACRIRNVRIDNGGLTPDTNFTDVPADFETSREVGCHLPDARVPEDRSVHGFLISLTTDGTLFSNEALYVVFDSRCLTCNAQGQCGIRTEMCMIASTCWREGEENPDNHSEFCDPARDQENWTSRLSQIAALPAPCTTSNNRFDRWDVWTSNQTGCPCFFDTNRTDCACCEAGACQCRDPNQNQCTLCKQELNLCGIRQPSPEYGIDGWTRNFTGCACQFDPSRDDCACCQNRGCQCGVEHRNQCSPCGQPEVCGSKPDVFGGLRVQN